ncbi:MAG: hypothetical protein HY286_02470 [Planctomycetes bacterium]|nr:hypothetical protein [Planctomycetota bacterium]
MGVANRKQQFLRKFGAFDRARWSPPAFFVACAGSTAAGLYLRVPYLLPALQAILVWPFFAGSCAEGRVGRAAARILVFALIAGAVVTAATAYYPKDEFDISVPRGVRYRDEMFTFIRSGGTAGEEAHFNEYAPMHALHFVLFVMLCAATAGFGGLVLGAALLDYMSYYVGSLVAEAAAHGSIWKTILCAWSPYAILRVIAYALVGAGFTTWIFGATDARARAKGAILVGIALALADVIAKHFLAHNYGQSLLQSTGLK